MTAHGRVLVVTALQKEFRAVAEHLSERTEVEHEATGTLYEVGRFTGERALWEVVLIEIGMGNVGAAAEVERAISKFQPEAVLVVGVAGGIKDTERGDVVVASKVYAYEPGKDTRDFLVRPEAVKPAYRWLERAKKEARDGRWLHRVRLTQPVKVPSVIVAPIIAGEKVLATRESDLFKLIRANFSDAVAVEMESIGVMRAVHDNNAAALIVRGVSDLIDDKSEADREGSQEAAVAHAAAFAFEVLARMTAEAGGTPITQTTLLADVEMAIRQLDFTGFSDEERPMFKQAFGKALGLLVNLREKLVRKDMIFQKEIQLTADALDDAAKKSAFEQARGANHDRLKALASRLRSGR